MFKDHFRSMLIPVISGMVFGIIATVAPATVQASTPPALAQLDEAYTQIAARVTPMVVNIKVTKKMAATTSGKEFELPFFRDNQGFGDIPEQFFRQFKGQPHNPEEFRQQAMGSGVIVSPDGYILTNAHVVKDAGELTVTLSDKRSFPAKVVGIDANSDVAVIKVGARGLPAASFGDSDKLRVGSLVMAVGSPFGLNRTVTSGIVSAKGRTNVGIVDYEDFIQTDAAINPGNSGGPLVNIDGEIIGINTAIASRSGGYQGIGFAIPSNSAKLIMDELMKNGSVRRGLLGVRIQDVTEALAKSYGLSDVTGAVVSVVEPGSQAEKAGVKKDDVIVKFNGQPVGGAAELKNMVGRLRPESTVKLTVFRNKKTMDLAVKIGERSPQVASAADSDHPETAKTGELGIQLGKVSTADAERLGLKSAGALVVKAVNPDGAGGKLGLQPGDAILEVDGAPVSDISGFKAKVSEAKKHKVIRLTVQRGKDVLLLATDLA